MKREESQIQKGCVLWFRYQYPSLSRILFAVPNGGFRNKVEASIMKAEGIVSGVADLILLTPRKGYGALCVEMKSPKGKQSEEQKEWQKEAETAKNKYVVCRSLEEFIKEVNAYLL